MIAYGHNQLGVLDLVLDLDLCRRMLRAILGGCDAIAFLKHAIERNDGTKAGIECKGQDGPVIIACVCESSFDFFNAKRIDIARKILVAEPVIDYLA